MGFVVGEVTRFLATNESRWQYFLGMCAMISANGPRVLRVFTIFGVVAGYSFLADHVKRIARRVLQHLGETVLTY